MGRFIRFSTALLVFGLLALPSVLNAQTAQIGTIAGQVNDESGGVLPGVSVAATSQERGFTRNTTTDSNGKFLFASMPLGRYRIVASLSGFETLTLVDNLVESEKTTELSIVLRLAGAEAQITVSGEVPIVDKTNTSVNTRVREKEFQKMPVGRSYQALIGSAPGVIGTGNVNAHGALSSNNQFLFDGVDTTDPTTGTFGGNLNFEAIQEVSIYTAGISAEYGRAVGAVINVITKSGTNRFEGSAKYIETNDDWNAQNKTKNQVTGASLARVKFDKINPIWSFTLGGPIWPDHAWFFGAYENAKSISPQRQTVVVPENFQESLKSPFWDVRLTGQITPSQTIWGKYHESPTNGFIIDYWIGQNRVPVVAAELEAMTRQDQTSDSYAGQWTGVFGSNVSAEAMYANNHETITVSPLQHSALNNGAPHFSEADGFYYNGASFEGFVKRPRQQATVAASYFTSFGGNTHSFKAGFDWQHLESGALFAFPNNQFFSDASFDPATRTFEPDERDDYDAPEASTSKGNVYSVYVRDKFEVGKRLFFEIGARYESQKGESDIGATTVDAQTIAPRFAAAFDLVGNGKTLINATYGRFYQYILQGFSDSFANIPQEENYNVYLWDGTQYVFNSRVESGANALQRNTGLNPTYTDEVTLGFQHQIGNTIGLGVRGIYRKWGDLIDDIRRFSDDPSGKPTREFVNYGPAKRKYTGIEFTFEKRFSQNWNASLNYTYSKTTGNHFADSSSSLGDFLEGNCRTTVDPTVGTVPCQLVQDGPNKNGRPSYDRPHDVKLGGAYTLPLGRVNLTLGVGGEYISGRPFEKQRTVTILNPRTGAGSGTTTYFYNERGSDRLDPYYTLDTSLEATVRLWLIELGVKGEVFNITDQQDQITVNNVVFCANTVNPTATCTANRNNYGTATARGSFLAPRSYRLTTLIRF